MSAGAVQTLLFGTCFSLLAASIALPYALGAPPRTRRDWLYIRMTVTFVVWLLAGFLFLRSA
jgi:hypothetical protein